MMKPHTFCSFCGARFPEGLDWPRTCPTCQQTTYRNPLPVAVMLVPVHNGLLLIRRAVEPQIDKLALPGGYINLGETWQAAGAREVAEETGLTIDASRVQEFAVRSAPDGTILVFGLSERSDGAALTTFRPNEESSERVIIAAPTQGLAFPLHEEVIMLYFRQRRR